MNILDICICHLPFSYFPPKLIPTPKFTFTHYFGVNSCEMPESYIFVTQLENLVILIDFWT